ncbi:hypothetical protein BJX61DRAFT_533379 [Aspergillus egyptiacus]|nr:hypothetical protein BJX61DRAFT_533379 [Aspergillus egyptiacus]
MTISTIPPLDLETARPSATACPLKLAALASHISTNLVLVGSEAEVLHSFPSILGAAEEECVCSSWCPESELVQSQSLTTSLLNASSGGGSEAKETVVVGNGADDDNSLALVGVRHIRNDARKRDRRAVNTGHKEPAQHYLVEVRFRAACISTGRPYGQGSGRASPEPASRRSHSSAPYDGCCAHGGGPSRYLFADR